MKEINIAKVLVNKRKEKGITQDELANYIGVSKASVSKWETGQSYPDITFLPELAAYFNISIDDLMDYEPQMTKEDIRKLYLKLSADFASKPFDEVMGHCRQIIKKYFSCFPLLLQMGILILNHSVLPKDPDKTTLLIRETKELFIRVKNESNDVSLTKQALYMEALCCIATNDPNAALELLEGMNTQILPPELLLASAYQMTGRIKDAKTALQAGIYQNIVILFNFFPNYLLLCADEPERFDEVLKRALMTAEAFDFKHLHPAVFINIYITAAQGYIVQKRNNKALDVLEKYTEIVTGNIYPLHLQGDHFFDLLDNWLDELDLGIQLPRDEKTIKQSMTDVIVNNPAFAVLSGDSRFQTIIEKLKNNCQEVL